MSNQAILSQRFVTSITFTGKPDEETRKQLQAEGFIFDGRSRQWYRKQEETQLVDEKQVASAITVK